MKIGKYARGAVRATLATIAVLIVTLSAQPANASGAFYGRWAGSSIAYVQWGSSCGLASNSANLNFGGGIRGGSTYIYDVYAVNGSDRVIRFTNGIRLYGSSGGGPVITKYLPDLAPHSSHRVIVDTTFPGTRLTSSFYPYVGFSTPSTDCGQTFTQVDP